MSAFDSAWRKWNRGNVHSESLKADLLASAQSGYLQGLQEITTEYNSKSHCIDIIQGSIAPPPPLWSALLGDLVNNYHAALDHVAWVVVGRGKEVVDLSEKQLRNVYFPICSERTQFNDSLASRLPGGRRTDIAIIRRYQPYTRGQRNVPLHVLTNLNGFSRLDKHRELQRTDLRTRGGSFYFEGRNCVVRSVTTRMKSTQIEPGAYVGRAYVRRTGPNPDVYVNGTLTFDVAMNDRVWLSDWLVQSKAFLAQLLLEFDDPPDDVRRPLFSDGWKPRRG
jgi:hypothetical protein